MKTIIQKLWINIAMLCLSLPASAYDFEVNGIQYDITSFTELTVTASSISEDVIGDVTIPSTVTFKGKELAVTAIGDDFVKEDNNITSITISNGVQKIGNRAFYKCSNLSTIIIPKSVVEIKEETFKGCDKIVDVNALGVETLGKSAFEECSSLINVTVPKLSQISCRAFANCSNLTSCVFKSATVIKESAFENCGVVSLVIPSTVTSIEKKAFYGCKKLASLNIPNNVKRVGTDIISGCVSIKELTIGCGIDSLPRMSYGGNPNLEKIRIEDSKHSLILKCEGPRVEGPNHNVTEIVHKNVESLGFNDSNLKEVYIGRNITTEKILTKTQFNKSYYYNGNLVEIWDFYYYFSIAPFANSNVSKVIIGSDVTSIDMKYKGERYLNDYYYLRQAFENCKELTEVDFQSSLEEIPDWAFSGCSNLQKIYLPNSTQELGIAVFENCTSLHTIDLEYSLESIGKDSFTGCDKLLTINIHSPNPPSYSTGFSSQQYINTTVNVPPGCLTLYQKSEPWKNFWNLKEDSRLDTGIDDAPTTINTNTKELTRYTINGQKISAPSKGFNIIRYNDGSVKKVVVQ